MVNKEKIVIYPYDIQFSPVLRHKEILGYDIQGVVSPMGWGLCGKDAGSADSGVNIGITVNNKLDDLYNTCDSVMFVSSESELEFEKVIYPKMIKTIEQGKNVICNINLKENVEKEIERKCREEGVQFIYNCKNYSGKYEEVEKKTIYDINVPVIFILGVSERTNKFEIQLQIRRGLMDKGYNVSQIGSRKCCEMLGFHSFPDLMYTNSISETSKIVLFNHFVKSLEINEKPDVIIIGVPGSIMAMNNMFTNNFGLWAFELSQAVTPDAAIVSTLYDDYFPEYFNMLSNSVRYKLGFEVTCFNMSNARFDWVLSEEKKKTLYTTLGTDFIDKRIESYSGMEKPVLNILNPKDSKTMADSLIDKLASYAEVEAF